MEEARRVSRWASGKTDRVCVMGVYRPADPGCTSATSDCPGLRSEDRCVRGVGSPPTDSRGRTPAVRHDPYGPRGAVVGAMIRYVEHGESLYCVAGIPWISADRSTPEWDDRLIATAGDLGFSRNEAEKVRHHPPARGAMLWLWFVAQEAADGDPAAREAVDRCRAALATRQKETVGELPVPCEYPADPERAKRMVDQLFRDAEEKRRHDEAMAHLADPQRAAAAREQRLVMAGRCSQSGNPLPLAVWYAQHPHGIGRTERERLCRLPGQVRSATIALARNLTARQRAAWTRALRIRHVARRVKTVRGRSPGGRSPRKRHAPRASRAGPRDDDGELDPPSNVAWRCLAGSGQVGELGSPRRGLTLVTADAACLDHRPARDERVRAIKAQSHACARQLRRPDLDAAARRAEAAR